MAFRPGGLCQLLTSVHLVCSGQRSLGQNVLLVSINSHVVAHQFVMYISLTYQPTASVLVYMCTATEISRCQVFSPEHLYTKACSIGFTLKQLRTPHLILMCCMCQGHCTCCQRDGVNGFTNLVHKLLSVTITKEIEGIHCNCTV